MPSQFERDLEIARQIQASFLPDELLQPPGWEVAAYLQPAREVAGDFYDVFPMVENRRVGLVIADVCDKGVGAALYMALFRTLLRAFAGQHRALSWMDALSVDPAALRQTGGGRRRGLPAIGTTALRDAVSLTNDYIAGTHASANMFATLFFGLLDPATGSLAYVNGGHEPPILWGPGGLKAELAPTGPIVGIFPEARFSVGDVQLEPGDTLLAFTDGVTEAEAPGCAPFGRQGLHALLAEPTNSAEALLARIRATLADLAPGQEASDDITLLAVRRLATRGGRCAVVEG
jgi:sigma-B regulation protein RsbU (phosphoserine phosphatase)